MKKSRTGIEVLTLFILASGIALTVKGEEEKVSLQSRRKVGQVDQVSVLLEAQGDVLMKADAKADKTEKSPLHLACKREYEEKTLEIPSGGLKLWRGVRHYGEISATLKEGDVSQQPVMRPDRRLIVVEINPYKYTPFCPRGSLTLDELELVRAVGNSLPLDGLLPDEPVQAGQKWKASDELMAVLLDLDEITTNTVETVLKEATPEVARLELSGRVEGKLDGAANQLEMKAKCRFDRKTGRIDWFAMRVKQTRDIGLIERGLDVTALVQMRIAPKESSSQLSDAALKGVPLRSTDALCRILYRPAGGDWEIQHDRSWFLVEHQRDLDVFRRVEGGQDIALCKISSLPKADPEKLIPLSKFQTDVQQALGKNFGEILESTQHTTDAGYHVYRVVAKGTDAGTAAQWQYYHVSDAEGRRASFAFRLDESRVEAFGKVGQQLVESLRFGGK